MSELPQAESADTDAVQMALQAAHTLWSRGDTAESLRWLKRAAESASDEGADLRSLQLAKAAAELRAKLFPTPSDAPQYMPARVPTQRDLTGVRPVTAPEGRAEEPVPSVALASGDHHAGGGLDDGPPASTRAPSSAPQYVVHRPREQQRQLMGLSSSTLETARQQNGSSAALGGYPSVPSWSAGSERRTSSPPPLPHSLDDYEELDAEPIYDSDAHAASAWAATAAPTWRPPERNREQREEGVRREMGSDSSPRVATLPPPSFQPSALSSSQPPSSPLSSSPLSSSPPPLPDLDSLADDEEQMRAEQPTVVRQEIDPSPDPAHFSAPASSLGAGATGPASAERRWDAEPATPAKLKARVHHQAVRVAVSADPRASGQYIVRPLREGERAPAGERVALLVALEPGVPLV